MKMWMRHSPLLAILALGITACDDGMTDSPALDDEALRADVALVAADGMFQDLAHMSSPVTWAGIGSAPGGMGTGMGMEFEGSKRFSRTVTFLDEKGEEQAAYDPEFTASMRIESELEREVTHSFWTAEIERERDMVLTGLLGAETERTWNGTGSGTVFKSRHPDDGALRTYDMESSAVITNVVRGVPASENPYPLRGTITRTIHAVITIDGVQETRDIVAVITFDGDSTATMTVDGETYEIDLTNRGVNRRFHRMNG